MLPPLSLLRERCGLSFLNPKRRARIHPRQTLARSRGRWAVKQKGDCDAALLGRTKNSQQGSTSLWEGMGRQGNTPSLGQSVNRPEASAAHPRRKTVRESSRIPVLWRDSLESCTRVLALKKARLTRRPHDHDGSPANQRHRDLFFRVKRGAQIS